MSTTDWFPNTRLERFTMVGKTTTFMNTGNNRALIGFEVNSQNGRWYDQTYVPKLNLYNSAYATWSNPATSTPVALENLKDAEEEFFPLYRRFHAKVIASQIVTNGQLEEMGYQPRHSGGGQHHSVDKMFIDLNVKPLGNLTAGIAFENRDTGKSTVPYYLTGAVLFYKVSDAPVTNQDELSESELATRSPHEKTFAPGDRGRYFSVAGRWQNRRGEKGPWSEIVSIIIP